MLKNVFALVGVVVVGMKAAEWYGRHLELVEENERLRAGQGQRREKD